jgi:hypothetical protein
VKVAVEQGMAAAWKDLAALQKRIDAQEVTAGDVLAYALGSRSCARASMLTTARMAPTNSGTSRRGGVYEGRLIRPETSCGTWCFTGEAVCGVRVP